MPPRENLAVTKYSEQSANAFLTVSNLDKSGKFRIPDSLRRTDFYGTDGR